MKGKLGFDPHAVDYGPASRSVRQLLVDWQDIDWFVPTSEPDAKARASAALTEHHALARAQMPEAFPERIDVVHERGGWDVFADLCEKVRVSREWDWKYSALKPLSRHHASVRGWSRDEERSRMTTLADGVSPRPGALYVGVGDAILCAGLRVTLPLETKLEPRYALQAGWYLSYAHADLLDALEWQLAERGDDLRGNAFVPLVRCYALRVLPFGLDASTVISFAFDDG